MNIDEQIRPADLEHYIKHFWECSGEKIRAIADRFDSRQGSPVITVEGKYQPQGWTEWTQGFMYGSAVLQFEATHEAYFLDYASKNTLNHMGTHVSHLGVHDHGFNNISTYGNLLRLMVEGVIDFDGAQAEFYRLALKLSGAIQASRWTPIANGGGFIYSFNGPHSLFVDTVRSCRILFLSHLLGHVLMGENDIKISLLDRAISHLEATANHSVYYGEGRDSYDQRGRVAHESIFNPSDGNYRCPNAQQGFSGRTTWTRGLAWAMCGFAEELELVSLLPGEMIQSTRRADLLNLLLRAARATCDFYIEQTPVDGIPYWDTGAPGLVNMGNYLERPAEPRNDYEPVDSSAAVIAAQGLLRLGNYLLCQQDPAGQQYWQAGLTVTRRLLDTEYLSEDPGHEGLILHSIYHQPNGWDHVPNGSSIANGESSMWGDYHARELVNYLDRLNRGKPYYCYFNCLDGIRYSYHGEKTT